MFQYIGQKRSIRFIIISSLLIIAAVGAAMISTVARQVGEHGLASLGSKSALGLALIILLYVVPRLARNVRLEYLRSEYSIHIPNTGLVFCSLILIVIILALSSGNNLLYLVLAILLATMFMSWLTSRLCLGRIDVTVRFPDHIFVDEFVPFEVTVTNRKQLLSVFSTSVLISEQNPATATWEPVEISYFPMIPAQTRARMRIERNFTKRGIYPIRGFYLSTKFPFGFLEQRRFVEAPWEIAIYPHPLPPDEILDLLPLTHGQVESRIKGSGRDLYAIRRYLSSDRHHHIDWKATAKTNQLMVREFTRDDDWRITIGFDVEIEPELAERVELAERFERVVSLVAGLITYFVEAGAEVRFLTNHEDSGFGMGTSHYYAMLRQLAPLQPEPIKDEASRRGWELFSDSLEVEEQFGILITGAAPGFLASRLPNSVRVISLEEL